MNIPVVKRHSWFVNAPYWIWTFGAALIFIVGLVGSLDAAYTLYKGHSFSDDVTPPTIDSAFTSTASCESTVIRPNAKVNDPQGGWLSRRTGLALVQLYVGGERIGEWPITDSMGDELQFIAPQFARRTTSETGPVIAVAHDRGGNFRAEALKGDYHAPYCFDAALSAKNGCSCGLPAKQAGEAGKAPTDGKGVEQNPPRPPQEKTPPPASK